MTNFNKSALQRPAVYFKEQGLKLSGGGEWKTAICPFHNDHNPSLSVRLDTGGFRCFACGVHGGDMLSFHMQRYGLSFKQAARDLGAWEVA